ncbi:hypothetical protein XA68_18425 [Ophiocordyceps unilateralis]|uniref:WH2 domain-containing protein n=1 Tax=Ophiocordyceps unilateralis TaxID=268505 RepID=A0A2A9PJD1_OPHUN|nr:hypothetical protein XA68_18425 [Ophiocordyceps unilateralis]
MKTIIAIVVAMIACAMAVPTPIPVAQKGNANSSGEETFQPPRHSRPGGGDGLRQPAHLGILEKLKQSGGGDGLRGPAHEGKILKKLNQPGPVDLKNPGSQSPSNGPKPPSGFVSPNRPPPEAFSPFGGFPGAGFPNSRPRR